MGVRGGPLSSKQLPDARCCLTADKLEQVRLARCCWWPVLIVYISRPSWQGPLSGPVSLRTQFAVGFAVYMGARMPRLESNMRQPVRQG